MLKKLILVLGVVVFSASAEVGIGVDLSIFANDNGYESFVVEPFALFDLNSLLSIQPFFGVSAVDPDDANFWIGSALLFNVAEMNRIGFLLGPELSLFLIDFGVEIAMPVYCDIDLSQNLTMRIGGKALALRVIEDQTSFSLESFFAPEVGVYFRF